MTTPAVEMTHTEGYYPSFNSMRAAHAELLRLQRQAGDPSQIIAAAQEFILKGCTTGCALDSEDEREAAQSLLDYWATTLYRLGVVVPETTLGDFDPSIQPEIPDEMCPYRGLNAFVEGDSGVFFGRSRLVSELVDRLRQERLLSVVGSSGSGKSSVVRAGLIPALKSGALPSSETWVYMPVIIPGSQPLKNLINLVCPTTAEAAKVKEDDFIQAPTALLKLLESCYDKPVVIVVDQFEEIFTLCDDPQQRQAMADNLQTLAEAPGREHRVILTLRVDFESRVATLPKFQPAFEKNLVRVTPLNAAELRQAIEDPASQVGLKFESGVVDALLNDILGEPAALPLLQFTLLKLWENRERNRVTWEAFRKLGGGRQALANSADEFYDKLIPEEQVTARRILLRLVRPGEGLEVTSRRMRREELYVKAEARDRIDRVLDKLVQARLLRLTHGIVSTDDQVEVAHEALVRNWPTLVNWLEDERQVIRERQRLTNAAERWQVLGRDKSALLRGVLLEEALRFEDLSDLETAYVEASKQQRTDEIAEAKRTAETLRRRNQIITWAAGAAFLAAVVAVIMGLGLLVNLQAANVAKLKEVTQRVAAQTSEAQAKEKQIALETSQADALNKQATSDAARATAEAALQQKDIAVRGEATATAQVGFQQATAVAARQLAQDQQVLADARSLSEQARSIAPRQPDLGNLLGLLSIQLLRNNQQPVSLASEGVLLDTLRANPHIYSYLRGHTGTVNSVVYNSHGNRLVSASSDGTVRLWDTGSGELLDVITPTESVGGLNIVVYGTRSNADLLAVGGCASLNVGGCGEGLIQFFDARDKLIPTTTRKAHRSAVQTLAFDRTGTLIASGGTDGVVYIWRVPTSDVKVDNSAPAFTFKGTTGQPIRAVVFSPDNKYLVSTGQDGLVSVRDFESGSPVVTFGEEKFPVNALAFSPDSRILASGGEDNTITLYDMQSQSRLGEPLRGHTYPVTSLAFSPDGSYLASASQDGTLILWGLADNQQSMVQRAAVVVRPLTTLLGNTDAVRSVAISPDGRFLASGSQDKTVILWNVFPELPMGITLHQPGAPITGLGFTSDGNNLFVSRNDQTLTQWDVETALDSGGNQWSRVGETVNIQANTSFLFFPPNGSPAGLRFRETAGGEVLGVDVSSDSGKVDWQRVREAGYSFTYLHATSGMDEDRLFSENWVAAREAGILRGAYHYFLPSVDPILQANVFAKTAYPEPGDLPAVLDLETTDDLSTDVFLNAVLAFLDEYQSITNQQPIIYTGPSFWNKLVEQSSLGQKSMPPFEKISGQYRLAVAFYSTGLTPVLPTGWSNWTFWQFTDQGNVDGIQKSVGVSRFNGTLDGLRTLTSEQIVGIVPPALQGMNLYDLLSQRIIGGQLPLLSASSAAVDSNLKTMAVGSDNGTITFWDVEQGKQAGPTMTASGSGVTSLAYSEDGRWLAAGSADGTVYLWDMIANPPTRQPLLAHTSAVLSLAFSKNKTLLASGSADGNVILWDLEGLYSEDSGLLPEQVIIPTVGQPLTGPPGAVSALAFSPDSKILASGNTDGNLVLWDVDPESWQEKAAHYANRSLSEEEKAKYLGGIEASFSSMYYLP